MDIVKSVCDDKCIEIYNVGNINKIKTITNILDKALKNPKILYVYESYNKTLISNTIMNIGFSHTSFKSKPNTTICFYLDEYINFFNDYIKRVSFIKFLDKANKELKCDICFEKNDITNTCETCGFEYCNDCFKKLITDEQKQTLNPYDFKEIHFICCCCKNIIFLKVMKV